METLLQNTTLSNKNILQYFFQKTSQYKLANHDICNALQKNMTTFV